MKFWRDIGLSRGPRHKYHRDRNLFVSPDFRTVFGDFLRILGKSWEGGWWGVATERMGWGGD